LFEISSEARDHYHRENSFEKRKAATNVPGSLPFALIRGFAVFKLPDYQITQLTNLPGIRVHLR
jgi:hypothetical protein